MDGLVYMDIPSFTTGMGMHGSAGERELHNFSGAIGPDFKQDFVDTLPTSNSDIAPTIYALVRLQQPAGFTGRFLTEAFSARGRSTARYLLPPPSGPVLMHIVSPRPPFPFRLTLTTTLTLKDETVVTSVHATRCSNGPVYMDSSEVTRTALTSISSCHLSNNAHLLSTRLRRLLLVDYFPMIYDAIWMWFILTALAIAFVAIFARRQNPPY